jgi:hypothetical protein
MNLFQRFTTSLRGIGLRVTLIKFYAIFIDHWFDFRYGVDTCSIMELDDLTIHSDNKTRGYRYQAARVLPLRRLFKTIKSILPANPVMVDFGSGKGRILLVASAFGFGDIRGVEFAHELCEIARKNCAQYKNKTKVETEFKIIESDAVKYEIRSEENVFIFYNPFDDAIMNPVLDNIAASVDKHPRKVFIVYYNPKWGQLIEHRPNFTVLQKLDFWGYRLVVYSNRS